MNHYNDFEMPSKPSTLKSPTRNSVVQGLGNDFRSHSPINRPSMMQGSMANQGLQNVLNRYDNQEKQQYKGIPNNLNDSGRLTSDKWQLLLNENESLNELVRNLENEVNKLKAENKFYQSTKSSQNMTEQPYENIHLKKELLLKTEELSALKLKFQNLQSQQTSLQNTLENTIYKAENFQRQATNYEKIIQEFNLKKTQSEQQMQEEHNYRQDNMQKIILELQQKNQNLQKFESEGIVQKQEISRLSMLIKNMEEQKNHQLQEKHHEFLTQQKKNMEQEREILELKNLGIVISEKEDHLKLIVSEYKQLQLKQEILENEQEETIRHNNILKLQNEDFKVKIFIHFLTPYNKQINVSNKSKMFQFVLSYRFFNKYKYIKSYQRSFIINSGPPKNTTGTRAWKTYWINHFDNITNIIEFICYKTYHTFRH